MHVNDVNKKVGHEAVTSYSCRASRKPADSGTDVSRDNEGMEFLGVGRRTVVVSESFPLIFSEQVSSPACKKR